MDFLDLQSNQLKGFLCAAESKSFTSAAKNLYISHTALILQMNQLEKTLGFPLFNRTQKGIVLTAEGSHFYENLKPIVRSGSMLISECQLLHEQDTTIRIENSSDFNSFYLYSGFYHSFQEAHPEITLQFVPMSADYVVDACVSGSVDVGFYFGPPSELESKPIGSIPVLLPSFVVFMSKSDDLFSKSVITSDDLRTRTLYISNIYGNKANVYRELLCVECNIQIFDLNMQNLFDICNQGGLILSPDFFDEKVRNLHSVPFRLSKPFVYHIIYPKNPRNVVKAFVDAFYDNELHLINNAKNHEPAQ